MKVILSMVAAFYAQLCIASGSNAAYETYSAKYATQKISSAKSLNEAIPEKFRVGPKDQKTFADQGAMAWNELKAEATDKVVTLKVGQEILTIEMVDSFNEVFKYNGREVNLSQYKSLTEKFKYIERVLNQKTSSNFKQQMLQNLLGAKAQALIPLLIWGGVAVAAWSKAAYEACNAELICSNDDAKIQSSVNSFVRYVNLTGSSQSYNVDISCRGNPSMRIRNESGDTVYDSSRSQVEMNRDTGNSSYTTLAMDLRNCCRTDKNKCERIMRDTFRNIRKSNEGSANGSSNNGGVN